MQPIDNAVTCWSRRVNEGTEAAGMGLENIRAMSADISTDAPVGGDLASHPEELEELLTAVRASGWRVLRDLVDPLGQDQPVSFVLVGPSGVVVMETADRFAWRARSQAFLAAAGGVAATLPAAHRAGVRAVLVLLGGTHDIVARCTAPAAIDTVTVADLPQWLHGEGPTLAADEVAGLADTLTAAWRGRRSPLLSSGDVPPLDACIPEASLRRGRARRRGLLRRGPARVGPRRRAAAPARPVGGRPDFSLTDLIRIVLVTVVVVAGLCFVDALGSAIAPATVGTPAKTPVTSSVVDGAHGQTQTSAAQTAAP